jgi:hypothetical protein
MGSGKEKKKYYIKTFETLFFESKANFVRNLIFPKSFVTRIIFRTKFFRLKH